MATKPKTERQAKPEQENPKNPGGRPTLMTDEVQRVIVDSIERGNYIETACLAAGIKACDYYNWQKWGKEGREPYRSFFETCARARAKAEQDLLDTARAGDGKGESFGLGKAAITILERTRPRKFSVRLNISLEKELDTILTTAERVLDPDQYAKLVEALSTAAACDEEAAED